MTPMSDGGIQRVSEKPPEEIKRNLFCSWHALPLTACIRVPDGQMDTHCIAWTGRRRRPKASREIALTGWHGGSGTDPQGD